MRRALVVVLPLALIPTFVAVACEPSNERAPAAPTCSEGVNCNVGPGPVSSGGSDTGVPDSALDGATFEVGEAGVAVSAIVHPLLRFGDPVGGTFDTTVAIRAPRMGGGTDVEATMPISADGTYTLSGVAPVIGGATWLQVWKAGAKRTLAAVSLPAAAGAVFPLPLFAEELPREAWNTTGQTDVYPTNPSTVVVHVFGPDNNRLAGARAAAGPGTTTKGPFFDVGTDVGVGTQTGAKGTIVFLGITGVVSFPVTLSTASKSYGTVMVPVEPNVVSYVSLQLD